MKGVAYCMPETYEFSESFQSKILALMARDKVFYITFREVLKPKFLRKDIHIDMARIIQEHYEKESDRATKKGTDVNPPTTEVLWEEVRKLTKNNKLKAKIKDQYEDCILDIFDADLSDAEYIKDNVIAFGRRSAIEQAIWDSVGLLEKGTTEDFNKIEDLVGKALRIGEDIGDLGTDYYSNAQERIENYREGTDGVRRIPTGISGVDNILHGGLGGGELGVVIAPPNRGKSIALINIGAGAVLEGYNVVHFTLEMPEKQVTKRYDQRLMGKSFEYMKDNPDKILKAIMNMQKTKRGQLFVKKYKTNDCTVHTMRSYLTRLWMEKGIKPDVIIVDYGDLVQPRRTYADKRFELESVYLDLRDLAAEYDCPVWTASQANRGALDKKVITIGDLAEAFNKANIADFMMALCQTTEEKEDGEMRIYISKHRDGEANISINNEIDYATMTLSSYE
ncbi:DNA helicase [Bacillus phage JL]|uniref:DNA helicase n=1 Tax=Bacillus phage JL TaxID=1296655 RepID=S5MM81_9CAUD|nr:helicase DnaB-like [Bacillus phage JL]AGR46795.1 DNA helicase [Bacillus phage JL]